MYNMCVCVYIKITQTVGDHVVQTCYIISNKDYNNYKI